MCKIKKYAFAILATASTLSVPTITATADPLYVSLSAGVGLMNNSNAEVDTASSITTKWTDAAEYKSGYALEGAVGAKEGMLRGEIAVGYQSNDVDKILGSDMATIEAATQDILEQWGVSADIDDLKITASAITVMYNLYADYEMNGVLTPYLMGGLGAAFLDMETSFTSNGVKYESSYDKTAFAWQVGAGLGIRVTNNVDIDLGYRYFNTGDIDLGSNAKLSFGGSKVMLGMRYNFF
jgi:opacity protein-like surface antigen